MAAVDTALDGEVREALQKSLHELSQPLTSVACQLECGLMVKDDETLRSMAEGALAECRRAFACVASMRMVLEANGTEQGETR